MTLKGPAGIGKSRLARRAARRYHEATGAETWRCDLAEARTGTGFLHAIAVALDVPLGSGDERVLAHRLGHAIRGRGPALVLLDDFEAATGLAPLIGWIREVARDARFLATGHEALRLPGEVVHEIGPLGDEDARALLAARATERGVDPGEHPDLARLAARLDGLPLALVLAAGRLGVLSVAEVLARLDLSLLRSGRADVPDRHASLRDAVAESLRALDDVERTVLAQLSVFRGGFALEAAEAVVIVPDGSWVVDVVAALADRSLLVPRGARFTFLEPIRAVAEEALADRAAVEERHGRWVATFASDAAVDVRARGDVAVRAAVEELENFVVASRRAVARGDGPIASAACRAALLVLEWFGPFSVAVGLADAALALHQPPSDRVGILTGAPRLTSPTSSPTMVG